MYLAERLGTSSASSAASPGGLPRGGDLEYADEVTLIRASRAARSLSRRCPILVYESSPLAKAGAAVVVAR